MLKLNSSFQTGVKVFEIARNARFEFFPVFGDAVDEFAYIVSVVVGEGRVGEEFFFLLLVRLALFVKK